MTWNDSSFYSWTFTVDSVDRTSSFLVISGPSGTCGGPGTPGTATATLPLNPGNHTLVASGDYTFAGTFHTSAVSNFTVIGPALSFAPAGPLTINAANATSVIVNASSAPTIAAQVTLTLSSPNVAAPSNTTIAANQTASPAFTVTGQTGGSSTITASAAGFQNATLSVSVLPVISALNPASGTPGTSVTINGAGFANGASVNFGNQTVSSTFVSSSQLKTSVPNMPPGMQNVTVTVGGQTSLGKSFQVLGTPPSATLLFRTSGQDVQTFTFTTIGGLNLVQTVPATAQGGMQVVGIAFNGQSNVLRTSSQDVQNFTLASNNTLTLSGTSPLANSSSAGAAIAAAANTAVRAIDVGLETYQLVSGTPTRQALKFGSTSTTGVAVDSHANFAIRAHALGVEVFDVSTASSPTLVGSATGSTSTVGVGVKFAPNGTIAVRSNPAGIEVFTVASGGAPTLAGSFNAGVTSTTGTAVTINVAGTLAIRAHSTGIEVYDITSPATPQRIGQATGSTSTTGVGVFVSGNTAFRATNSNVEAFDITTPNSIPPPKSIQATTSSVGVGLSGK